MRDVQVHIVSAEKKRRALSRWILVMLLDPVVGLPSGKRAAGCHKSARPPAEEDIGSSDFIWRKFIWIDGVNVCVLRTLRLLENKLTTNQIRSGLPVLSMLHIKTFIGLMWLWQRPMSKCTQPNFAFRSFKQDDQRSQIKRFLGIDFSFFSADLNRRLRVSESAFHSLKPRIANWLERPIGQNLVEQRVWFY